MTIRNKQHAEVLIIGAGTMGMAAGYFLAKSGVKTILIDAYDPPHIYGSHHGETRLFRYAYQDQEPYVPLALRALDLWKELEREASERILDETGVLSIAVEGPAALQAKIDASDAFDLPVERYSSEDMRKRWPGLTLPESAVGLLETRAGILSPEKAIESYRRLALREGASYYPHTRIEKIIYHPDGVTVKADHQTFTADQLLISSGAGNTSLLQELELPMKVMRKAVGWFSTKGVQFHSSSFPGFVISKGTKDYYGFPDLDGSGLKIGRHDGDQQVQFGEEIPPFGSYLEDEQDLRECLDAYMPQASGPLVKGSTCLYTMTPDEHFILDRHPNYSHVVLAAGFSGHGFKFASSVGEALSQIFIKGRSDLDMSLFKLDRFRN